MKKNIEKDIEKDIKKFSKKYPRSVILYDGRSNTSLEPFTGIEVIGFLEFQKHESMFQLHNIVKNEATNERDS